MFEVSINARFSAAHHLVNYPGSCAEHHGHNWEVEVFVKGGKLNDTGILVDFRELKISVADVLDKLDHKDLNALSFFKKKNPTSENLAKFLFEELSGCLDSATYTISRVKVKETPESTASYWKE